MTDRYAVIGNPVAQSQSPRIHALFARAVGHELEYGRILGTPGHFADDVRAFRAAGGRGLNATVPFKLDAHALATERTARAAQAGAVNTLKFEGDRIIGDNTDGAGLVRDIERLGCSIGGKRVLLMGAGGAARGVMLPLLDERPAGIAIANRTLEKAQALATQFAPLAPAGIPVRGGGYAAFAGEAFDLVINATSASLAHQIPSLPQGAFAQGALAYDMVYGEAAEPFLARALAQGAAQAVDGLGMLVEQAAESFFLWRGLRPPTAPVLALLRRDTAQHAAAADPTLTRTR
ncbi:MAG TPA: shikimate dehydrogenase [Casimicrobiaceae bacterium]